LQVLCHHGMRPDLVRILQVDRAIVQFDVADRAYVLKAQYDELARQRSVWSVLGPHHLDGHRGLLGRRYQVLKLRLPQRGISYCEPELRVTPTGAAVANLIVAANDGRYDPDTGEWVDRGTTLLRSASASPRLSVSSREPNSIAARSFPVSASRMYDPRV
jgi:hypothetical protein